MSAVNIKALDADICELIDVEVEQVAKPDNHLVEMRIGGQRTFVCNPRTARMIAAIMVAVADETERAHPHPQ